MRSIRTQLIVWLVAGILLLMCGAGVGLYSYMDEVLEHDLDATLLARADTIASAVHMEEDGQPHMQMSDSAFHDRGQFYFQIWRDDGKPMPLPKSAGTAETLPPPNSFHKRFSSVHLANGLRVRITQLAFVARPDEEDGDTPNQPQVSRAHLIVVIAHDRRSIDGPLAVLLSGLLAAAALVTVGILLIVTWVVRRGLRPLDKVSAMADRIGPDTLDLRFPSRRQLPVELAPISEKLNDLLDRLAAAFSRERRFSAAVAHELRTPLAELRTACDVALRWPDDAETLSTALGESRDVAVQMSTLVQTLLSLARVQSGAEPPAAKESVRLAELVTGVWPAMAAAAASRQLTITQDLPGDAIVQVHPALLKIVVRNLLENAVEYTPANGRIEIRASRADDRWTLQITNTCQSNSPADTVRFFEPFWRADTVRTSGSGRVGLGLTLVKAYCDAMKITVEATVIRPGEISIVLGL